MLKFCPLMIKLIFDNNQKLILTTIYRVGTLGIDNFDSLDKYLKDIHLNYKNYKHIIVGDLNLSEVDWDEQSTNCALQRKFLDTFHDLGMKQYITGKTHQNGNTLDLLFTNNEKIMSNIIISDSNNICKSDHYSISFRINMRAKKLKNFKKNSIYNFKKANWSQLNKDLRNINWPSVFKRNDVHLIWNDFKKILFALCDKNIPKITLRKNSAPPWFDSELDEMCKNKAKLHKKYKQTGNIEDYKLFSIERKKYKKLAIDKMNKSLFLDDSDMSLITKKFWGYVKYTANCSQIPDTVKLANEIKTDPTEKATLFNKNFYRQFSEKSYYNVDIDFNSDVPVHIYFSYDKIYNLLKTIKPGKACGPDGIHGKIFKNCAKSLCGPLSDLFNLSFNTGMILDEWKLSNVVPIYKKGKKDDVSNYRPISLTSLVMKTFEKCIRDEIMSIVTCKINTVQHGFLPHKSCNTQMIEFTDDLHINLDKGYCTDVVYFDFSKAFDSVSHDIILEKLKFQFGVDGLLLKFLKSYLENRKQRVVINGCFSDTKDVLSGVPQGSILGPLLFVLFINDIYDCISEDTKILLYADDTKIWRQISGYNDSVTLQSDIDELYKWSITNKIYFNSSKCKAVTITNKKDNILYSLPLVKFHYMLGDSIIDYTMSEKDLGIIVTSNLHWKEHIDMLLSKASARLGLVKRSSFFVNNVHRKRVLYLAMVRSLFDHCDNIWRPTSPAGIERFEKIQKRAVKWIINKENRSISNDEYLKILYELKLLPIGYKFLVSDLKFLHKIYYGFSAVSLPSYIKCNRYANRSVTSLRKIGCNNNDEVGKYHKIFSCDIDYKVINNSNHPMSKIDNFSLKSDNEGRTSVGRERFFNRSINQWNKLPVELRQINDTKSFEDALKTLIWKSILEIAPD